MQPAPVTCLIMMIKLCVCSCSNNIAIYTHTSARIVSHTQNFYINLLLQSSTSYLSLLLLSYTYLLYLYAFQSYLGNVGNTFTLNGIFLYTYVSVLNRAYTCQYNKYEILSSFSHQYIWFMMEIDETNFGTNFPLSTVVSLIYYENDLFLIDCPF